MDIQEYKLFTRTTVVHPEGNTGTLAELMYLGLGMAGEAGEIALKVEYIPNHIEFAKELLPELGDVLWYITRIFDTLELNLPVCIPTLAELKFNVGSVEQLALNLCGQTGEAVNKLKKVYRDQVTLEELRVPMLDRLDKALNALFVLGFRYGFMPSDIIQANVDKLTARKAQGKLHGAGDHR